MGSFSLFKPWEPQIKTIELWDGIRIEQGNYIQRISPEKSAVLFLNTRSEEHRPGSIITLDFKTESKASLSKTDSLTGLWSAYQNWRLYDDLINKTMVKRASKIFKSSIKEFPFGPLNRKIRRIEAQFPYLLSLAIQNYQNLLKTFSDGDFISFDCLWKSHCSTLLIEEIDEVGSNFNDKKYRAEIAYYIISRFCLNHRLKNGEASREQMILYMGSMRPTLSFEKHTLYYPEYIDVLKNENEPNLNSDIYDFLMLDEIYKS